MSTFSKVQSCARTKRYYSVFTNNAGRILVPIPSADDSPTPQHMNFPSTRLCYHWDTLPPTDAQLVHANGFFTNKPPKLLWSTSKFYSMAFGDSPEICVLGRSNVSIITPGYPMVLVACSFCIILGLLVVSNKIY